MKKIDFKEWILYFIVGFVVTILAFVLIQCDSQHDDRYITPPDPYVTYDKTLTVTAPRVRGEQLTVYCSFPPDYDFRKRGYMDYGNSSSAITTYADSLNFTYKEAGTYLIRFEGWNKDNTSVIFSDAIKIIVKEK